MYTMLTVLLESCLTALVSTLLYISGKMMRKKKIRTYSHFLSLLEKKMSQVTGIDSIKKGVLVMLEIYNTLLLSINYLKIKF